jgi:hypothetical protein
MTDRARTAWRQAVDTVAQSAREALPACAGRIAEAVKLVLMGDVQLTPDGAAEVGSQTEPAQIYPVHGKQCPCQDYQAPDGFCKHVLAARLYIRALELTAHQEPQSEAGHEPASPEAPPDPETLGIDPRWIRRIHQSKHVLYAGLLDRAWQQGLVSLTVTFLHVSAELATAQATATFADGRTFTECGDATPGNVTPQVAKHFARVALTRAKARCLRDALNLGALVAAEELGES